MVGCEHPPLNLSGTGSASQGDCYIRLLSSKHFLESTIVFALGDCKWDGSSDGVMVCISLDQGVAPSEGVALLE